MSSKRLNTALMILLALLTAGLLGGVYGVNKLLGSKADGLVTLKAKSQALAQEQINLDKAKQDIKKYQSLNQIAQAVVPQDKSQAEAVRQIVNIAAANNVTLASITFPSSTLGNVGPGSAAASGTAGQAATGPASPAAITASNNAAKFSQLTQVKNIPGVYQLPITINNDDNHPVTYANFISFLGDLERNRRTSQVQTINIEPQAKNRNVLVFTLTLNEYIKP